MKKFPPLSTIIIYILLVISLALIIILSSQPLCSKSSSPSLGSQGDDSFVVVSEGEVSEYQSTTLGIYDKVAYRSDERLVLLNKQSVSFLLSVSMVSLSMFKEGVNVTFIKDLVSGGMQTEILVLKLEF